jgi:beta-ribofuranosylaminobenzene 5'-phosphate synthase
MIEVLAYPRIHFGLVDLGYATLRSYGGSGFVVDAFPVTIQVKACCSFEIDSSCEMDSSAREDLRSLKSLISRRFPQTSGRYTVATIPPQHVGLGSKTALIMALLVAINTHNGYGWTNEFMQSLSGRGGASGVGVNGFFTGGFIVDCGHPPHGLPHKPSSAAERFTIPPVILRKPFPVEWRVHLLLPAGNRVSGRSEVDFFQANTPVARSEVLEALAATYHGIVPAISMADMDLLKTSLRLMHGTAFKAKELGYQDKAVKDLFFAIQEVGDFAVGLSSLGPLIYLVSSRTDESPNHLLAQLRTNFEFEYLGCFSGRNSGYEVKIG